MDWPTKLHFNHGNGFFFLIGLAAGLVVSWFWGKMIKTDGPSRPMHPWQLGRGWITLLMFFGVLGFLLLVLDPQLPFLTKPGKVRMIGFILFSMPLAHFILFYIMRTVVDWFKLDTNYDTVADFRTPALVGLCETPMYTVSLLMGKPEFIGVWLAVKVAGDWVGWRGEQMTKEMQTNNWYKGGPIRQKTANEGRRKFNAFLVGNALSISLSTIVYWFAKMIIAKCP